ncbi:CHASE2 domain-containing protein [Paenibacillus sp. FA6]|uniref:CHASE2 domain-containing protein n=1 Tax=Paenibacillus sp. FA6 TaxID=3413029 RepID=UPI003F65DEB5
MKLKLVHAMALLTALVCILMYRGALDSVDNFFEDRVMQHESAVDTRIAIIAIDDQSLEDLGSWPWSRSIHAGLIDTLTQGNPAVIAFDVTFPTRSDDIESDHAFEDAVSRAGNVILPAYGTFAPSAKPGDIEALGLSEPYPELKEAAGAVAHINTMPDRDHVVRKSLYSFNYDGQSIPSFAWSVYQMYMEGTGESANPEKLPLDDFGRFHISYSDAPQEYEAIPYSAVLSGEVPAEYFENRIVLIGPYAVGFKDDYLTPLSGKGTSYGVEIHANIVQELLDGDFKKVLDWKWNVAILLVTAVIAYYLFRRLKLLYSFLAVASIIGVFMMGGSYIYGKGTIISLGYVIPFLIVSCIVVICFRYVQELLEKRRVTDIFGRYVAPQVVNQILKSGDEGLKLGGSRRELTILFVDIRGFTTLSEITEPEEIVEILNEYLDLTANCIFQYDGTLDKFIGDATMAIFNAPLMLEDHPMKAVQAAWAMKEGSVAVEEKLIARFGFGVKFGIGIHTGPAVFGNIGSKTRMDYTAIGDTVNTAARLESYAKPGQIIISEATYEAVQEKVTATSLGEIKVKGKEQGISIYALEGLK